MSENKGYVYVLSNPSMPGIVKIGRSKHGGQGRADTLYKNDTGVATPFQLEFECYFTDCILAEKKAHKCFALDRVNKRREFFNTPVWEAKDALLLLAANEGSHESCSRVLAVADISRPVNSPIELREISYSISGFFTDPFFSEFLEIECDYRRRIENLHGYFKYGSPEYSQRLEQLIRNQNAEMRNLHLDAAHAAGEHV